VCAPGCSDEDGGKCPRQRWPCGFAPNLNDCLRRSLDRTSDNRGGQRPLELDQCALLHRSGIGGAQDHAHRVLKAAGLFQRLDATWKNFDFVVDDIPRGSGQSLEP
jgi:hypothetical protein